MISKSKEHIGYNDALLILLGIPVVAMYTNFTIFGERLIQSGANFFSLCFLIGLFYTTVFWFAFRELYFFMLRKYGYQHKRYFYLFLTVVLTYSILSSVMDYFIHPFIMDYVGDDMKVHKLKEAVSVSLITAIVMLTYESGYLINRIKNVEFEKEKLINQNISSQLESLKNRVNPHFLFNSLNTLCNLIPESPERAENFVQKLSKVYRYILEIRDKKIISLGEELECMDAYKILLKERFADNIVIDVDVPKKHYQDKVIPLSLQILMENAIKHNIISMEKPLTIFIYIDDNQKLVVKNNLQLKSRVSSSTKFGLENIKERYRFFTEESVDVIPTAEHFIVVLPLIENQKDVRGRA